MLEFLGWLVVVVLLVAVLWETVGARRENERQTDLIARIGQNAGWLPPRKP